jgi:hypothetical protein
MAALSGAYAGGPDLFDDDSMDEVDRQADQEKENSR